MRTVYVVCENKEYGNGIVGIYVDKNDATNKQAESPTWRYIEEHDLHTQSKKLIDDHEDYKESIGECK